MSCSGCEIHGRSGFAFLSSHSSKALCGLVTTRWGVKYAGLLGGGYKDKFLVQLFVVEDFLGSYDRARHPLQVTSSKSGSC